MHMRVHTFVSTGVCKIAFVPIAGALESIHARGLCVLEFKNYWKF